MSNLTIMRRLQLAAGVALLAAAGAAQAQWMWVDANGLKQVSDRPPPASVPLKNILKSPVRLAAEEAVVTEAKPAAPAAAPTHGMTLAEREADYRKRMAEKGELEKKQTEQDAQKSKKAAACQAARANAERLASGERVRTGSGRAEFMSDKERAEKAVAAASFMSANCQ